MSELGADFDAQDAEVCGLYLDPPENAIVVSIDDKTGIQAKRPVRPDTPPAPAYDDHVARPCRWCADDGGVVGRVC